MVMCSGTAEPVHAKGSLPCSPQGMAEGSTAAGSIFMEEDLWIAHSSRRFLVLCVRSSMSLVVGLDLKGLFQSK